MEIKVRAVEGAEEKSIQEVEQELLDKSEHNDAQSKNINTETETSKSEVNVNTNEQLTKDPNDQTQTQSSELKEEDVLSFVRNKYGKEINSFEDIFSSEPKEELPEDVAAYLKFKKETGRGINDFIKYNESIDDLSPEDVLARYYADVESDLDSEEIKYIIEDKFGYDEDLDDQSDIKKKQIAKKKELAKAKKHLEELKEKYSAPLESNGMAESSESSEEFKAYKKYIDESKTYQEEVSRKADWFKKKTEEVFGDEFKGFEFNINDNKVYYTPSDRTDLKNSQLDVSNFVSKFLDESGLMKDAVGYHRSLSMAMNPDKYAKFFYEQGKSDAVENSARASKNVDMDMRSVPQSVNTQGTKIRSVGDTSGKGLRIRSGKK